MHSYRVSLALLLFALFTHPKSSDATIIANGGFEDIAIPLPGYYQVMHVGSTLISPWEISRENVDLVGSYWQAAGGAQSLDLNGSGGIGAVAQTFSTIVGQLYRVTFAMAANPDGCGIYTMAVAAAGSQAEFSADVCTPTISGTVTSMGWEAKSWDFIATSETTTLEFSSLSGSGESGPALDDVAVVAVPEPSVASLIMAGLVAIGISRRVCAASRCPTSR